MEIQEIIESAIKGGWSPFGIGINLKKEGWGHKEVVANFFYQSPYLLDKNFWEAAGKDKGWYRKEKYCPICMIKKQYRTCKICSTYTFKMIDTKNLYEFKMHAMIDHIIEGGTAESYIKSL